MTIFRSRFADVPLRDLSITERVFEGMDPNPDAPLLIDGVTDRVMTGGQAIAQIKALAGGLTERGFGAGQCLALMAPNCPEYFTVFHGCAWAGGTVTTINPTYTASEVRHQLLDAGASVLVTVPMFLETALAAIEGTSVREIAVIGEAEGATPLSALMGTPLDAQVPVNYDDHPVVLPYSSGTTGLPKGVMLTHRNLVVNIDQVLVLTDLDRGDRMVAFLPFFHIYGMQVLMNAYLAAGGALVTMPRFDLEQYLRLNSEHRCKRMYIVPPIAVALAKHPMVDQFDLSSVEHINSGAAPLGGDVTEAVGQRLGAVMTQGFGMTELSPVSHMTPLGAPRKGASGVAVSNTECRIVDTETGRDLGPNEIGELWVRGPQVMKGYLNRPDATAETIDSEQWLHTGDVGLIDEDGYLFLTDRVKELIKVKGFQVAPAELEAALLAHPNIADAAVIGVPDDEAGEVPMAFIVPAGSAPSLADVQAFLMQTLSHYKQIHRMEVRDAIPKSASGKILRRVLRDEMKAKA